MPRARGRALVRLAAALADGEPVDERLPGIGPWTTAYVALRSGDDDAFLPTDLGVKHGLTALGADPGRAAELAEAWRPYRGFAGRAPVGGGYAATCERCHGVRIRGPSPVTAIVNSKCAASEPSSE